jgi:putative ABC transport system permease protein
MAAALVSGALAVNRSVHGARITADARRVLTDSGVPELAGLFVVLAVYLSALVVGLTMASAIARQAGDLALARALGATAARVRAAVALQAAAVAIPATVVGVVVGGLLARFWLAGLAAHEVIPTGVAFRSSAAALPAALAVTVGTSLLGALIASVRVSRQRPSVALTAAAAPRRGVSVVRTAIGVLLVAGGVVLSVVIARGDPRNADGASFFTMLAMCVGTGFLGPALLRVTGPVARLAGGIGTLAADSLAVRAKALSGALVPLLLAVAFAAVKVLTHTTSAHVHGVPDPAPQLWTEYTATGVYVVFAAVAAVNMLATVLLARRRELAVIRLVGASRVRALAVVICEASVVMVTGLVAGAVVALVTVVPMLHGTLGTWRPYLPAGDAAAGVAAVAALVGLGTAVPALVAMRRPPVESVVVDP